MNIRQLRDLAIKFIGLSCLSSGVIILAEIFSGLGVQLGDLAQKGAYMREVGFLLMFAVATLLYGGLAYLLLFKSDLIARVLWRDEEESDVSNVTATLEMGVALVGLYHIPNGIHRVASESFSLVSSSGTSFSSHFYGTLFGDAVLLAVAVLCIVKSKTIAAYIRRCAE
jgi:hypothetical protein